MDHQYKENGTRNIYSNYNQMKAYVECFSKAIKSYILLTSSLSNRRNFEDSGKMLATSVFEFYQNIAVQVYHDYEMVTATVCVQIDNCFCYM